MNKSLNYIKTRIGEGNCNNMPLEEFSNMGWVPASFVTKNKTGVDIIATTREGDIIADLKYNPDAEFNYFITETCVCDGTLLFMRELMNKIIYKIKSLNTYYAPTLNDISEDELSKYKMSYEIGDFVTNSYIVESTNKSKPWLCDKFTVMLPVRFVVKKIR